ncbi:MAG: hypothetical protein Q4F79_10355 [Eubacteriales bacterium]|nr:hypothetical protein [Eubacteriales bacterium]
MAQETTFARLATLDEATQKKIAKKYYGGNRPWKPTKERNKKS